MRLKLDLAKSENMPESLPRVVIVGGGFGGLAAAKALKICGSHRARVGEVNTGDCICGCTLIAATRHGRVFEQMNSQHERTQ
jgi:NADH dehydrogenase FAD-containing subunit